MKPFNKTLMIAISHFSLILLTVFISACQNQNNSGNRTSDDIPESLDFNVENEIKSQKPLNPTEKIAIGNQLKLSEDIPSIELLFDSYDSANRSKKEEDLNKLKENVKKDYFFIQNNCRLDKGAEKVEGEYGIGKTRTSATLDTLDGGNCPVLGSNTLKNSVTVTAYDQNTELASFDSQHFNYTNLVMVKPDLLPYIPLSKGHLSFNTVMKGRNVRSNELSDFSKISAGVVFVKGKLELRTLLKDRSRISADGTFQLLSKPNTVQKVLKLIIAADEKILNVIYFQKNSEEILYVNGESYTAQRLKEDFGVNVEEYKK